MSLDSLGQTAANAIAKAVKENASIPNLWVSPALVKEVPRFPAFIVGPPRMNFPEPYEAQDHLGEDDWNLTFKANLTVKLDNAGLAQQQAIRFVEEVIQTLKDDPTLDGSVAESSVTLAEPVAVGGDEDKPADYLEYRLTIETSAFTSYFPNAVP